MKWDLVGSKLTEANVHEFEKKSDLKLPDDLRWFLENVFNGAVPDLSRWELFYVPVGDHESEIHVLYGIGHPESFVDLAQNASLEGLPRHFLPIGHNLGGDPYVLVLAGPHQGQVRHVVMEELWEDGDEAPLHFVAENMHEFARLLQREPTDIR